MANTIDRKSNRKALHNKILSQFLNKDSVVLTFEQWENLYFTTEENCVSGKPKPADSNGYVRQGNLFDMLNNPNKKGVIIKNEFLSEDSAEYQSLKDKVTFVRTYACFDFDWTTKSTSNYCSKAQKSNPKPEDKTNTTQLNLSDYVGTFESEKDGIFNIILSGENGVQKLRAFAEGLPPSFNDVFLDQTSDKYTFEIKQPSNIPAAISELIKNKKLTIKYSADFNTIDYDMAGIKKGTAKRITSVKKTDDKKSTKNDNKTNSDDDKVIIKKTVFNYPDVDDRDVPPIGGYKENNNFPYRPNEMNDDIGDLNQMFFGDRRGNVFSTKLLKRLNSIGAISPSDNDPKITQDIYNELVSKFKKNVIKESVKKVLKQYINKK